MNESLASSFPLGRRSFMASLGVAGMLAAWGQRVAAQDQAASVSLDEARAQLASGRVMLIDVREPSEHETGVAAGARLIPRGQLMSRLAEIPSDAAHPVLLICNTQNRSRAAWQLLQDQGLRNVRYVEGGMSEWRRRGWPLVMPRT